MTPTYLSSVHTSSDCIADCQEGLLSNMWQFAVKQNLDRYIL